MKKYIKGLAFAAAISMAGCGWDAGMAALNSYGSSAHIVCYSGGKVIYDGYSTGKVENEDSSDGFYFKDDKDGRLKDVSGQCVIDYGVSRPRN